jgi:hypothetical protein
LILFILTKFFEIKKDGVSTPMNTPLTPTKIVMPLFVVDQLLIEL